MKKLVLAVCVMFISVSMFAQNRFEKGATKTVAEMTEVMSLTEKEAADIYKIELASNMERADVRKESEGKQDVISAKMKELNQKNFLSIRIIVGEARLNKWFAHLQAEREKSKN
ncbi:hypothetical protein [Gelidibacter salicanalis]|uniref:Uncharacterized protein n=1 Tax=Gelidibacter salicanalis TaxID=291193 RepID=A0A934KK34_9FLAO|nr:hypothetical protein [Gelidibacter salicanalis]MBJ7880522.1 hypothetical protein [Gelidibacter salicanalis]